MSETLSKIVAQNIVAHRKKLNLSQKELAVKLGITNESMGRIERGVMAPKFSRLQDIADALQCSVSCLFKNSSPKLQERVEVLTELLEDLSTEKQEAVLSVMYTTINALQDKK